MDPVTQRARYEGDAMTAYVKQHEVTKCVLSFEKMGRN